MKVSTKLYIYFFSIAIVASLSAESFLTYDKTHKAIWLIPCLIFAVAFLAICVKLFSWWAMVYKINK